MAYTDIGYDEFLNRIEDTPANPSQELSSQDFDSYVQEISGSKIQGGLMTSPDGILKVDLENSALKVSNGSDLIDLGKLPDGSIGLLVRDQNGNTLLQASDSGVFIQGPSKHLKVDATNEQIVVRDENDVPIGVLGLLQEVT